MLDDDPMSELEELLPCSGSGVRLKYPLLAVAEPIQSNSPLVQLSVLNEIKEKVLGPITVVAVVVVTVRVWISKVKRNKSINMVVVLEGSQHKSLVNLILSFSFLLCVHRYLYSGE